ncbi:MAG: transporter [Ignavibacteriae bacterium]|nr:transporter [Ignavibacteriota bacterium]
MKYLTLLLIIFISSPALWADEPGDFDLKLSLKNVSKTNYSPLHRSDDGKGYWTSARPDGHAPIGVMGDHVHSKGEMMFSYMFMNMYMSGMLDGTDEVLEETVVTPSGPYYYTVTPKNMTTQMHMLGIMYAPSNYVTITAMVPYLIKSMDHTTRSGVNFTTESNGLGDITLSGIFKLYNKNRNAILGNLGVIFPSGKIDAMDVTPASSPNETILPYPMQLGSGTFGIMPAITYLGQTKGFSWGVQSGATIRFGENNRDYRLGNKYYGTIWAAAPIAQWISASFRVTGNRVDNITGADTTLNANMVPTANPNLQAGTRVDAAFGFNLYSYTGGTRNLRFGIEGSSPIYQNLDGPQLKASWSVTAGIQYSFTLHK